MRHRERCKAGCREGQEAQSADPIGVRGNKTEIDASDLPQEPRPDEHAVIPPQQQELRDGQAEVEVPHTGAGERRVPPVGPCVPGRDFQCGMLVPAELEAQDVDQDNHRHFSHNRIA